jgi:hypothetical protein
MKRSETKQKNIYFVSLLSKTKKSKAKRSEMKNFGSETKRKYLCIDFALVGSEIFEAK